jgi:hypothetical protein
MLDHLIRDFDHLLLLVCRERNAVYKLSCRKARKRWRSAVARNDAIGKTGTNGLTM